MPCWIIQSTTEKKITKKRVNEMTIEVSRRFSLAVGQTTRCISSLTLFKNLNKCMLCSFTLFHDAWCIYHNACSTCVRTNGDHSCWPALYNLRRRRRCILALLFYVPCCRLLNLILFSLAFFARENNSHPLMLVQ